MSRGATQFTPGYFERLGRSPGVDAAVREAAEQIAETARDTAPVDTREYKDGIQVQKSDRGGRVTYRVVGTDPKTMLVESTTGNLLRALRKRR